MILGEERLYRKGDKGRLTSSGQITLFKRIHLKVGCDEYGNEQLVVKSSFLKCKTHHHNNPEGKDLCELCRIKQQVRLGERKRPCRTPNISEFHPSHPKAKGNKEGVSKNGYIRAWTKDINHPRISKNQRDKSPTGGRVYEHILVVEKNIDRYLSHKEHVHHLDGDRTNNTIDNLVLCKDTSEHNQIHTKMEKLMYDLIKKGVVKFDKESKEFKL